MKIISLNTWAGVVLDPLLEFFTGHTDVDVFCLQEMYCDAVGKEKPHPTLNMTLDLYERIEERLRGTHVGYFRPAHRGFYGIAMFVKKSVEVLEEGDILIYNKNIHSEIPGLHCRNLQYIRVSIQNKPVLIANVHGLWNGRGKTDAPERIEQSKAIRSFIDVREDAVVIVGDFNLNPDTQSLSIIENGLRNLVKEFGITSTRTSFYKKEGKFADYAFVSPELHVATFKVLPDEVSDHAPLFLEIQ